MLQQGMEKLGHSSPHISFFNPVSHLQDAENHESPRSAHMANDHREPRDQDELPSIIRCDLIHYTDEMTGLIMNDLTTPDGRLMDCD